MYGSVFRETAGNGRDGCAPGVCSQVTLLCSSLLCDCEVSLLVTSRAVDFKQRLTAAVPLHLARRANLHSGAQKEATRGVPVSDFDPVSAGHHYL